MRRIPRPQPGEFPEYAEMYMRLLPPDGGIEKHLQENFQVLKDLILPLSEEKLRFRYAAGKWTIKEILVHLMDDERIYAYRALRIARNDKTELPGFEQDEYIPFCRANERSLKDIFREYSTLRKSTLLLFKSFDQPALVRTGTANGHTMSVRALIYHLAGHELHHLELIREKYLNC